MEYAAGSSVLLDALGTSRYRRNGGVLSIFINTAFNENAIGRHLLLEFFPADRCPQRHFKIPLALNSICRYAQTQSLSAERHLDFARCSH
jgi:hypothetical protein